MKKYLLIGFVFFWFGAIAQDSTSGKNKWTLSGYIKDLAWITFNKDFSNGFITNLIHNRINLKWKPTAIINGSIEIRNRFYWGDDVKTIPGFKDQLKNGNEWVHLSESWFSNKNNVLNSNIERLWLEYRKPNWNLRVGRQRINWGITNTWNPNDLFNTYNFLDFDYEERPGSDAVKLQFIVNDLSHVEFAFAGTNVHPITAAKYFTNYKKYDLQWIVGLYQNLFTTGFGWAGSISDVGFKGEAQFYAGNTDSTSRFNLSMEADYIFKNGWYLSSAILYNGKGLTSPLNSGTKLSFQATPLNLMPARWNLLISSSKEFTPLFSGRINIVYSPGVNMVILFPSFTYNLKNNLDLDFVWQSFFADLEKFGAISHTGFLRLKWSY
jgi:hypothetical protein